MKMDIKMEKCTTTQVQNINGSISDTINGILDFQSNATYDIKISVDISKSDPEKEDDKPPPLVNRNSEKNCRRDYKSKH